MLPHHKGLRPWPVLRLGLFLYDHLGGRRILPGTRRLNPQKDAAGVPPRDDFTRGFGYSDGWVEDARLVVLSARDAAEQGAEIRTRTPCVSARRDGGAWRIAMRDEGTGTVSEAMAGILVNAAGPWAADILGQVAGLNATARVRMVNGSHVVTRRLYGHDRCYIFQNSDGRMCFAFPCQDEFTLNGTTDEEFEGDPSQATISEAEREYLCRAVRGYVKQALTTADVVGSSAGVRPLYDQGATRAQEAARDYVPNLDAPDGKAPMLSVFGGKITTYRCLAEAALARLSPYLPGLCPAWTAKAPLPGDDVPWNGAPTIATNLVRRDLFLAPGLARRFVRYYGARSASMLGAARGAADLGRDFGAGLTEREVAWQMREEWVREAADVLRRRTKLGLRIGAEVQAGLAALMASQRGYLAEAAE